MKTIKIICYVRCEHNKNNRCEMDIITIKDEGYDGLRCVEMLPIKEKV